jgi:hypothetical protein
MSNKDNYETSYRTMKGFHIIGYDADTDTFSKLHIDEDGHIYTKLLGAYNGGFVELASDVNGNLQNDVTDRAARDLGKVDIASLDQYTPISGRLPVDGSGVTQVVESALYAIRIDEVSNVVTYIGKAEVGSVTGSAVWQISKLDATSGVVITWADGDTNFNNIWDNRAILSYL